MTLSLREFTNLKESVDNLRRRSERAIGARDQLLNQLKKDFKVKNVEEGKALRDRMEKELKQQESEYEKLFSEFNEKYGHLLEE